MYQDRRDRETGRNREMRNARRRDRNRQIKYILFIGALLLAVAAAGAGVSFWRYQNSLTGNRTSGSGEGSAAEQPVSQESDAAESPVSGADESSPAEDWKLMLVNKWNPLPQERSIETVELENGERVDTRIYGALQTMFADMEADGVYPTVASGYRTQQEQEAIYNEKIAACEAEGMSFEDAKYETERWVAVPGTSEHQLGLAVDINADGIHSAGYEVYEWLERNAYLYGFIYRYPEDKTDVTGVANEPWHYRYVGEAAAAEIHERGVCLEEYLAG